jgi:8-oxo-dGTP diphosphatase
MTMITKAALLVFKENKTEILFVRPRGRDYFIFPGGKKEDDESIDDALQREIHEELNTQAKDIRKIGIVNGITPDGREMEMHLYIAQLVGIPMPHAEIQELKWMSKDYIKQNKNIMTPMTLDHVLPFLKEHDIW